MICDDDDDDPRPFGIDPRHSAHYRRPGWWPPNEPLKKKNKKANNKPWKWSWNRVTVFWWRRYGIELCCIYLRLNQTTRRWRDIAVQSMNSIAVIPKPFAISILDEMLALEFVWFARFHHCPGPFHTHLKQCDFDRKRNDFSSMDCTSADIK